MTRALAVGLLALLVLLVWAADARRMAPAGGAGRSASWGCRRCPPRPSSRRAPLTDDADGVYVSTTTAGDWLDRVAAHGLGARSAATMAVTTAGVSWLRQGAPDVFASAVSLRGARREPGMAGKFVPPAGLVVVTWRLGEVDLDTGFRPASAGDADRLVQAVERLVPAAAGGAE